MSGRCLIVANQTLGGGALVRAVEDCLARGVDEFFVVVPMTRVQDESMTWTGGFLVDGELPSARYLAEVEAQSRRHERDVAEASDRAGRRLAQMIDRIQELGGSAAGEVSVEDPIAAARNVLEKQPVWTEVIVSTLPAGISRWLKMDLPSRIARMTDAPVTTIEADPD